MNKEGRESRLRAEPAFRVNSARGGYHQRGTAVPPSERDSHGRHIWRAGLNVAVGLACVAFLFLLEGGLDLGRGFRARSTGGWLLVVLAWLAFWLACEAVGEWLLRPFLERGPRYVARLWRFEPTQTDLKWGEFFVALFIVIFTSALIILGAAWEFGYFAHP